MSIAHLPLEHHRAPVSWSRSTAALVLTTAFAAGATLAAWAIALLLT